MEDQDYVRCAADIQLMTSVLSGTRQELDTKRIWVSSAARTRKDPPLRPFIHLANLLNTEPGTDMAVTGSITPDRAAVAIVVSSRAGVRSSELRAAPFELVPVLGQEPISVADVLEPDQSKAPGVDEHARDLFQVLKYVHDGTCDINDAKRWVVSRCRCKLAARFKMIHTSWRDPDLIALLRTWQPAPNEVITGYMDLSSPEYGLVVNTIRRWGVVDEEKRVQLGGGGAARFVGDCLASIVERLQDLIVSQMTPDDLTFVFGVLWILRVLLLHEKTKWLFTQTSLAYHVKPSPQVVRRPVSAARTGPRGDAGGFPVVESRLKTENTCAVATVSVSEDDAAGSDTDIEASGDASADSNASKHSGDEVHTEEYDADIGIVAEELPASGTYNEEYAYQYLVNLTAGLAAVDHLCWNRVLPHLQNYTATVVMLDEPPTQPSSSHQFLFDAIDNHWDKILRGDAKEILRGKLASAGGAGCRVHAEAGLMALDAHLHGAEVPADMQEIATIFEHGIGALPVGITGKCCPACTRLSKRLLDGHHFILPDSHGVVYPWSPPPFGVPPHVLRALRDDLVAAVVQWAIEQADSMHEGKNKRDFEIYNPPVWKGSLPPYWLEKLGRGS
ncbi:hypothetical protein K466DRAFT_46278 [Polyporus arcularius HHB13444]|uniref:Uncharacterized protein n=1 Tax=Polyporus arcularius HHB13444 TaxID=1314778 RepID=A0A5C3PI71_9APHY|nr:hypothetical protein K466DRAFT_46278 [Polyporus arcularius HHB13444]